jgi:Leucine-rich repeat (LRR) protein
MYTRLIGFIHSLYIPSFPQFNQQLHLLSQLRLSLNISPAARFFCNQMKLKNTNLCALWCINYLAILLFSMNLLWFQTTTAASALGNETDRLVLLKIKEFITNDPHDVMSSWNDSIPFCNWHGVTCSLQHQRVTTLNLEGNNLVGSISPYIGNLTLLRFIYLQNNSFSGNIPQQVGRLFRLQHLNLTRNIFGGEIPVNWSSCSELKIVDFKVNSLIGQIPTELGYLAKLVVLNLGVNNLTGGIPLSLGNLSSLTGLSVAFNNIAGKIPDEIGRLKRLSIFTTSSNQLTGMVSPSLYNMSSLTIINFRKPN